MELVPAFLGLEPAPSPPAGVFDLASAGAGAGAAPSPFFDLEPAALSPFLDLPGAASLSLSFLCLAFLDGGGAGSRGLSRSSLA